MPLIAQEWTFVDKLDWGAGPWVTEPDKVLWQDEATGYWCLANRNYRTTGSWCGYVAVPQSHPYFNKTDRDLRLQPPSATFSPSSHYWEVILGSNAARGRFFWTPIREAGYVPDRGVGRDQETGTQAQGNAGEGQSAP